MTEHRNPKKKTGPLATLVEGTRRRALGIPSDEYNSTSWVSTLILIVVLIIAFFLFS